MSSLVRAFPKSQANSKPHLIKLLQREIPDLRSAENELRWIGEYVEGVKPNWKKNPKKFERNREVNSVNLLHTLCLQRSKGKPLQYILKSQPFGDLDIECRPDVLIPRPETEAYTTYLATKICDGLLQKHFLELMKRAESQTVQQEASLSPLQIRILDACSGSGCISLLLHKLLSSHIKTTGQLRIDGVDVSTKALSLARHNLKRNIARGHLNATAASEVAFIKRNVLQNIGPAKSGVEGSKPVKPYHIIVSNPPYISQEEHATGIPRSVRDWEPVQALVPPKLEEGVLPANIDPADIFYLALIRQYQVQSKTFMLLMEIGDEPQAKRVLEIAMKHGLHKTNDMSVWRDSPDVQPSGEDLVVNELTVPTEGQGNVRAVIFVRHANPA